MDEGRFILITNNMNKRGQDYNQLIRSKTKSFRYNYEDSASYMHSASITEDYLILSEIPFHFSLFNTLRTILTGDLLTNMFKWNPSLPTYFRVIRLDNGEEVARIAGPAFFTFHHVNAYQISQTDGNEIVIDMCTYDDGRIVDEFYLSKLRQNLFPSGFGYLRRFHLNLTSQQCSEPYENLQDLPTDQPAAHPISHMNSLVPVQIEFPRINSSYVGQFYRYVYAVRGPPGYLMDALVKIDVETRQICGFWQESCTSPCEPIFVPKPGSAQEDDGIVLTIIFEQQTNKSFILLLDGITFKEISRGYLPVPIPFSLHGNFY
jgi:carotenoid cleavage dioxygenase-like enzyme